MALTVRTVEELAPDQASLNAAAKLRGAGQWPLSARDGDGALVWGECKGSGSTPYRVVFALGDLGYKCTCPSRKFPCKHVLALMWRHVEDAAAFPPQQVPEWVEAWLDRRRPKKEGAEEPSAGGKLRVSATAARADTERQGADAEDDEKTAARAAAQRARNRQAREHSVHTGLDELERWIGDQLDRGIAAFVPAAADQCRLAAKRLVDAKAPGLATWMDTLPSRLLSLPEAMRIDAAIEALGGLYLLIEAYRRQDALDAELRHDVRRLVGWTTRREELLADAEAPRATATWTVVATRSEVQPDRLRRLETWLARSGGDDGPRFAALIDFTPVATGGAASPYAVGERFEAEIVFYPSSVPLRGVVAERGPESRNRGAPTADETLPEALDRYDEALARFPWLGDWPLAATGVVVASARDGLYLTDAMGEVAVPITAEADPDALPLVGMEGVTAFGLWNGRLLSLQSAATPIGLWAAG